MIVAAFIKYFLLKVNTVKGFSKKTLGQVLDECFGKLFLSDPDKKSGLLWYLLPGTCCMEENEPIGEKIRIQKIERSFYLFGLAERVFINSIN